MDVKHISDKDFGTTLKGAVIPNLGFTSNSKSKQNLNSKEKSSPKSPEQWVFCISFVEIVKEYDIIIQNFVYFENIVKNISNHVLRCFCILFVEIMK